MIERPAHQQRVFVEAEELAFKYGKLKSFCASDTFDSLPVEEQVRLRRQCAAMVLYLDVLQERIAAF